MDQLTEQLEDERDAAPDEIGVGDDFDEIEDEPRPRGRTVPEPSVRRSLVVIRPTAGWRAIDFAELWRFRELLFFLTWRDVKIRYKQTVLGFGWAVIQPVMTMIVFNIVFGKFGKWEERVDIPYPVFLYSALLPWTFFSGAVSHGGISLIQAEKLISKVYFPRLLIPFSAVGTQLVDFAISFVVMIGIMAYYIGFKDVHVIEPGWHLLLLPVLLAGVTIAAIGAATLLSALSVAYRDFRYVIPFFDRLWMFACPIFYRLEDVPERFRRLYALNPMAGLVDGFRSALLAQPFHWDMLAISLASTIVFALIGMSYFRRVERRFADIV